MALATLSRPTLPAAALAAALGLALRAWLRRRELRGTPPGSLGLPVVGSTLEYVLNPLKFVADKVRRHGDVFKLNLLFSPTVFLTGEHAKQVFKMNDIGWPGIWMAMLGRTSITTINGPRHKFQRSLINAAFSDRALAGYLPVLEELTKKHLARWSEKSAKCGHFNPEEEIKAYTFEMAEQVMLGTSTGKGLDSMLSTFNTWLGGFEAVLPFRLPFTAFGKAMAARGKLLKEYQAILDQKRAAGNSEQHDMLANVMKEGQRGEPMTDEELGDFCITMMFAGHDTTKASIQSVLHFLGESPSLRSELEAEVAMVWDGSEPITWEMAQKCQAGKCGRFINEVLRVLPPVSATFRVATDEMEIAGYRIPKGWKVSTSMPHLHEQARPLVIDLSIDHSTLKPLEHLPFGGGSRMCVGYRFAKLEMLVWLMHMLKHCDFHIAESTRVMFPFSYMRLKASFAPKATLNLHGIAGA